jgi:formate dehydrogenase subunit gamma
MGCKACHDAGNMGSPIPPHHTIRPSHLATIACESCHIPQINRSAARGVDASTGALEFLTRPPDAKGFGDQDSWEPDYQRRPDGAIYPLNSVLSVYWGNRDADSLIYPLYSDKVTDDNGDGIPEVNRPEEIVAGLQAFQKSLAGNQRFKRIQPVYLKAETAYELAADGTLDSSSLAGTPMEGKTVTNFAINHNTAPPRHALGANGCGDCHTSNAHFFKGQRVTDLYDAAGMETTRGNGRYFGCNPVSFAINSFHQQIISPYVGVTIMIIIFLIVLHYHSYGPKRITFDPYSQEIQRFSLTERGVHLFRLISFVILGVTGLILAFNLHPWQELLFSSPDQLLYTHIWAGVVFIITSVFGVGLWFRDAIFASYDRVWVQRIGGYLGYKGEVPAGRFNAGQKMFYWYTTVFALIMSVTGVMLVFKSVFMLSTICVTSTIHNLIGFVLIAGVLAHAYLGTIANPGTWRVLVDGSVTREWAHHHHPNWYRSLIEKGIVSPEQDELLKKNNEAKEKSDDGESSDSDSK